MQSCGLYRKLKVRKIDKLTINKLFFNTNDEALALNICWQWYMYIKILHNSYYIIRIYTYSVVLLRMLGEHLSL